ncbi:MAG: M23 family metallopeptidase [Chromatiales bacterium]|nr:MAG: M23 family metallopeptidase [Chromatiales bacterium]
MAAPRRTLTALFATVALGLAAGPVLADVFRYQDKQGNWVFTDRAPPAEQAHERVELDSRGADMPVVEVRRDPVPGGAQIIARNECLCPAQVAVWLTAADNLQGELAAQRALAVLPPGAEQTVMVLRARQTGAPMAFELQHGFILGDPAAEHRPDVPYLPPIGPASEFLVTQAAPDRITHVTPDSQHAIDIAMPEGSGVFAAREGTVVAVAYANFLGGVDAAKFVSKANQVRILHDDGTFAVYAHLAWDSIRVRPGQRVARGERIAASGNTGFTTGPHLHFVVLRNEGLKSVSIPVRFSNGRGGVVTPRTGQPLVNP